MARREIGSAGYYDGERKPIDEKAGELAGEFLEEEERKANFKIAVGIALIILLATLYLVSSGAIKMS